MSDLLPMMKFRDFFQLLFIRRVRHNPDYYDVLADVSPLFNNALKIASKAACKHPRDWRFTGFNRYHTHYIEWCSRCHRVLGERITRDYKAPF